MAVLFAILFIVLVVTGRQILERLCRAVEVGERLSGQMHRLEELLKSRSENEKLSEVSPGGAVKLREEVVTAGQKSSLKRSFDPRTDLRVEAKHADDHLWAVWLVLPLAVALVIALLVVMPQISSPRSASTLDTDINTPGPSTPLPAPSWPK